MNLKVDIKHDPLLIPNFALGERRYLDCNGRRFVMIEAEDHLEFYRCTFVPDLFDEIERLAL